MIGSWPRGIRLHQPSQWSVRRSHNPIPEIEDFTIKNGGFNHPKRGLTILKCGFIMIYNDLYTQSKASPTIFRSDNTWSLSSSEAARSQSLVRDMAKARNRSCLTVALDTLQTKIVGYTLFRCVQYLFNTYVHYCTVLAKRFKCLQLSILAACLLLPGILIEIPSLTPIDFQHIDEIGQGSPGSYFCTSNLKLDDWPQSSQDISRHSFCTRVPW